MKLTDDKLNEVLTLSVQALDAGDTLERQLAATLLAVTIRQYATSEARRRATMTATQPGGVA
jgi:hypothetical protein